MKNFWRPPTLLSPAKHQECVGKVGIEAHKYMPQRMTLRVNRPTGNLLAENTITEPKQTAEYKSNYKQLCKPLGRSILSVNIIFVHSWNAEKNENDIMHFEANTKMKHWMSSGKKSTVHEEEDGHCTAIMPIWRVEDVHVQQHLPYHRSFITLLLPELKRNIWTINSHPKQTDIELLTNKLHN